MAIPELHAGTQDAQLLSECASSVGDGEREELIPEFDDVVVKKPWGYEYLAFDNQQVAIWILHLARKQSTSMHCHPNKHTGLLVLNGEVTVSTLERFIPLKKMESVNIDKNCFHSTEAHNCSTIIPSAVDGAWVMEIEAPSKKYDLVRAKDAYGRSGKAYESGDNLVEYHDHWIKVELPSNDGVNVQRHLGCIFSCYRGHFDPQNHSNDAVAVIVGRKDSAPDGLFEIGKIIPIHELQIGKQDPLFEEYDFLIIEKEVEMQRLSDYVADFIASLGVTDVFSVSGGGAMHLVDAVGSHPSLNYVAVHHEQAAAMAAESYSRISRNVGVALFTTGPGGTNALTGVAGAWIDSIPTLFISGQVTSDTLLEGTGLRQFGIQESNIDAIVKPMTKYSITIRDASEIRYEMEKAIYIALSGRPGPVWVDIPLDIQSRQIDPASLRSYEPPAQPTPKVLLNDQVVTALSGLKKAERPVLITGYGIHLAHAEEGLRTLVERLSIPMVSSWTSSDLIDSDHPDYVGRAGIMGDRASNFVVQNADLILVIGSRMSIPQVGYNYDTFARSAKIIMVDIDNAEMSKPSLRVDVAIQADAGDFIAELNEQLGNAPAQPLDIQDWRDYARRLKAKYPVVLPEYAALEEGINSFYLIDQLSRQLPSDAVIVTDMGTSFTCTMQTFNIRLGQRLTTSSGHASMGFGLPGAIGACYANGQNKTICLSGEGGLMMNVQELQTISHQQLPIILFVINNGGYLTIKHMQQNHFGRYVGSEVDSGVSTPDILKLAAAHEIPAMRINNHEELRANLSSVLAKPGPFVCEIMMPEDQALIPRSSSLKRPDGSIVSKPLEDLYPFLERDEFLENMVIEPVEVLKN